MTESQPLATLLGIIGVVCGVVWWLQVLGWFFPEYDALPVLPLWLRANAPVAAPAGLLASLLAITVGARKLGWLGVCVCVAGSLVGLGAWYGVWPRGT
jgi:hypothetical protein